MHLMHARACEVRRAVPLQAVSEQWCAGQVWIHTRFRRHCTSLPYRHWCGLTAHAHPSHAIVARMLHPILLHFTPLGALLGTRPALGRENGQIGLLLQVNLGPPSRPATTWHGCMTLQSGRTTFRRPTMASTTTSTPISTGKIPLHQLTLCSLALCTCCEPGRECP